MLKEENEVNTKIDLSSLTNILYGREYAYDVLRRFFIEEPRQEYLKIFIQHKMVEQFPFAGDSEGILEGVKELKAYFQEYDVLFNQQDFDDLHWDYTRMLIGPFELPVPPWESIYVQKEPMLFQNCTISVRKMYEKFGFEMTKQHVEAEDHIGLELDFIYHLNKLTIESTKEEQLHEVTYLLQAQEEFLHEHLMKFASAFCEKMIANAETPFYRGLAKILMHYLTVDSAVLKELLNIEITPNEVQT